MSLRQTTVCMALALAALGAMSCAQDVHIVLRARDDRSWFHLGEPIVVEAACVNLETQRYLLPCNVIIKAEPASENACVSANRIDQLTWQDAQSGLLPPQPRGRCGNVDNALPSQQSTMPTWKEVTLEEPFPANVGQYKIKGHLAFDLEMADRSGKMPDHSSSDEIEIGVDDNLGWKNHLIHFHDCDYDNRLTLMPDREAIAALRKHLDDCAVADDGSYAMLLHETVWLKMQVEQPALYRRMVELEGGRPAAEGEVSGIRQWFRDQYRSLLLETAQQFVGAYKSHPELRRDEYFEDNLEIGFQNWHDTAASLPGGAHAYLSADEVTSFLVQASRTKAYIIEFMREEKDSVPTELPQYPRGAK